MADPSSAVVVTDFDGTLSPIVDDPTAARPADGAVRVLHRLAAVFATVAVVSGRPAAFLVDRFGSAPARGPDAQGPILIGLYGMESVGPDGTVTVDERAIPWLPVVEDAAARLRAGAPDGVLVETKGTAVTVHWRRAPGAVGWVGTRAAEEAVTSGMVVHPGRFSLELRPPLAVDKGTVLRGLAAGRRSACFLGDDLGDLPAYAELARLHDDEGLATVGVAVVDDVAASEVEAAADLTVAGPAGAVALLEWLADSVGA